PRNVLDVRNVQNEAVELGRSRDLTAEPAHGPAFGGGDFQHLAFHVAGAADLLVPGRIDIDVAGGAGQTAAAFADDGRHAVGDRGLHQVVPDRHLGRDGAAVM